MSIKAVVFDLDDTLFPEIDYVKSGYNAVAQEIEKTYGIKNADKELFELFEKDRKNVFDRFLKNHGLTDDETSVGELVDAYRTHTPNITLSDEVKQTLIKLRTNGYKLGVITDGRPNGQRLKIAALELNKLVDKIIITDELGGEQFRKPNPAAFEQMAREFNINLDEMMYVGDNPKKDFAIGKYDIVTVRIKNNGLYSDSDYTEEIKEKYCISTMNEIEDYLNSANVDDDSELLVIIKDKLLQIMDFIHEVCVNENIKYSLSGGTMLGAVRHKGFIPWDDDVDICMKREDYNKFTAVINKYCEKSGKFMFYNYRRTPRVKFIEDPIVENEQIEGIKVDIFLIDNLPDDIRKRRKFMLKLKVLQGMMHKGKVDWSRYSFKRKLQLLATKIFGIGRSLSSIVKSYNKVSAKYNGQVTENKFFSNDLFAVIDKAYKSEWFDDVITVPFEDRQFYIFGGNDDILKVRYGDYMQLPPENERKHHHNFTVKKLSVAGENGNCE